MSRDWGRYGRRPVMLLSAVALIDSVDRGILPGVVNLLPYSDSQAGVLGSVFVIMGLLFALPAGYIADRRDRTRIIGLTLASWGVISALNAAVMNFWEFLGVRSALGVGDTINHPAAQSLVADYYPATLRGRAYAYTRVAPILGMALGLGAGGAVGSLLGWRWAFLIVGAPGSLLAVHVMRLPEPPRGDSDERATALGSQASGPALRATLRDSIDVLRIPVLRSLMIGTAISAGATTGFGFWAAAFYARHTSLSNGQATGLVGSIILLGAVVGTLVGGAVTDRLKARDPGAPMLVAGVGQVAGGAALAVTFLPEPLLMRLPLQLVGVMLVVAAFPALAAMTAEVVPADMRGISFSVTGFLSGVASAISPVLIGAIADQYKFRVHGEMKGNLADAFLFVSPLIIVGGLVLFRGRRHLGLRAEELGRDAVDDHAEAEAHDGEGHGDPAQAVALDHRHQAEHEGERPEDPR